MTGGQWEGERPRNFFQNPGTRTAARLTGLKNFSEVEKINDHKVYAKDWHLTLQTKEYVDEDVKYAGVRGHHMVSVYEDKPEKCASCGGDGVYRAAL